MSSFFESPNFRLAKIILSKQDPFRAEDIMWDMRKEGIPVEDEVELRNILKRYRDNGVIVQHGTWYSVNPL